MQIKRKVKANVKLCFNGTVGCFDDYTVFDMQNFKSNRFFQNKF